MKWALEYHTLILFWDLLLKENQLNKVYTCFSLVTSKPSKALMAWGMSLGQRAIILLRKIGKHVMCGVLVGLPAIVTFPHTTAMELKGASICTLNCPRPRVLLSKLIRITLNP